MMRIAIHRLSLVLAVLATLAAGFFWTKVHERDRLLDQFIDESLRDTPRGDVDSIVVTLSREIYARTNHGIRRDHMPWYDRWESTSYFNVSTGVSLKMGIYGVEGHSQFGPCGTMSRVLLNALWRLGIPARKLQLLADPAHGFINHTMVEYWDGSRWIVISPSDSSFIWHDAEGRRASVDTLARDSLIVNQVHAVREYWPATFANTHHIRWAKLPRPLRWAFRTAMGPERFEQFETPRLYDQPRHLFLLGSLIVAAIAIAAALMTRPRQA